MNEKIKHVCFLIDGCRTYSITRGLSDHNEIYNKAYLSGAEMLYDLQKWTFEELEIPFLSVALTTRQNHLKRVDTMRIIMDNIAEFSGQWIKFYNDNGVKVKFIGDVELFINSATDKNKLRKAVENLEEKTKDNKDFYFFPMVAYDSTYEYLKFIRQNSTKKTEDLIKEYYGVQAPPVDFLVRFWRPRLSACIPILVGDYSDFYLYPAPFQLFKREYYQKIVDDYTKRIDSRGGGFFYTKEEIAKIKEKKEIIENAEPYIIGTRIGKAWLPIRDSDE